MRKLMFMAVVVCCIMAMPLSGKDKDNNDDAQALAAAMAHVTENVNERDFMIYADQASTAYGYIMNLNEPYYIRIIGNKIDSHLPYIGRSDNMFAGSQGLMFKGNLTNFKIIPQPKNETDIIFEVTTMDDTYKFLIELYVDGSLEMTVSPLQKQPMYFDGYLATDTSNYTGKL